MGSGGKGRNHDWQGEGDSQLVIAPPVRWVLDDGPLGVLSNCIGQEIAAKWPSGELLITSETKSEAAQSPPRQELIDTISIKDGKRIFDVITVQVDGSSAGQILYGHFRRTEAKPKANLSEHLALTWLLSEEREAVFVTSDKTAAAIGLSELGRCRVAYSYEFWEWLIEQKRIPEESFRKLCRRTHKRSQYVPIPYRLAQRIPDITT